MKDGDDPADVARTIVTTATGKKRKPAGPPASRVTTGRRPAHAGMFDKQTRKNSRLPA